MPKQRHSRYPAEQWQAWIDEQSHNGQSQQVFCEQKGLSRSSFQHWKRRLASDAPGRPPSASKSALFTPVSMPATDETDDQMRGWEIELDLGDGVCLRFRRGG